MGADETPLRVTTTCAVPLEPGGNTGKTCHGNCALICPELTKSKGTGRLLMVTFTPLNELERGMEPDCESDPARSVPKIEISEPGATWPALSLLAAFKTPPAATAGV